MLDALAAGLSRFRRPPRLNRSRMPAVSASERQPWGQDAYSALRWAFNRLARSEVLPTAMGSIHQSGRGIGLSRADLHAQASMIRDVALGTENPLHRAYLTAYFLGPPSWERKAGGGVGWVDRSYDERSVAVHAVAWWLMGTAGTGAHRIRAFQELVLQYTLGKPSNTRLRDMMKTRRNARTVTEFRERGYAKLDELHENALEQARWRLEKAGLI